MVQCQSAYLDHLLLGVIPIWILASHVGGTRRINIHLFILQITSIRVFREIYLIALWTFMLIDIQITLL
jgi:hypothetical protein